MSGFGGAGAFSDGKYNITNDFGGTLYEYIGKKAATELIEYVDEINIAQGGEGTHRNFSGELFAFFRADRSSMKRVNYVCRKEYIVN